MKLIWGGVALLSLMWHHTALSAVWSEFSAPTVEHLGYYFAAEADIIEQTLLFHESGSETVIASGTSLSGHFRLPIAAASYDIVRRVKKSSGTTESVVFTITAATTITGTAIYNETITLSRATASSGFSAMEGVTVTVNDYGTVTWENPAFIGLGEIELNGCTLPGFSGSVSVLTVNNSLFENGFAFSGNHVTLSACLLNGYSGNVYDYAVLIDCAGTVEISGCEIASGCMIDHSQNVNLHDNTIYRNVWIRSGCTGARNVRNNTILGGVSYTDEPTGYNDNYFGAPGFPGGEPLQESPWLCPYALQNASLDNGSIIRCAFEARRNVPCFRTVRIAAGQTVMVPLTSTVDNYVYPDETTGLIRTGLPFAFAFDLRASVERLEGVTYELVCNGVTYTPDAPFTATARRDTQIIKNKNNASETLNFSLPAPSEAGTNTWALYADFSGCSANIVLPSPARTQIAYGGLIVEPGFARPLRIGVMDVQLLDGSSISNCSAKSRSQAIARIRDDLLVKLPLKPAEVEVMDLGSFTFSGGWISSWFSQTDIGRANQLSSELEWFVKNYNASAPETLDFVVGVVPVNGLGGADGVSMSLRRHAVLVDEYSPDAALHEIGHAIGLYTSKEQYEYENGVTPSGYYSKGRGQELMGMTAFNASGRPDKVVDPGKLRHFPGYLHNGVYDVMGAVNPQWISAGTFYTIRAWLREQLGTQGHAAASVASVSPHPNGTETTRLVHLGGLFSRLPSGDDIRVPSIRAEEIVGGEYQPEFGYTMNYQFRTYDADGYQLSYAQCRVPSSSYVTNSLWEQTFAVPADAVTFSLVRTFNLNDSGGETVWRRTAGPSALANGLTATYDPMADTFAVDWSYGGTLQTVENRLQVSTDEGVSWRPLPVPTYTQHMTLPHAGLTGGSPTFRLVSSDGPRTAISSTVTPTGTRTVERPPTVTILSPRAFAQSVTGTVWSLSAEVTAPDENLESVVWRSSLDGFLGSGQDVASVLTPGNHRLTVVANDFSGLSATDAVDVAVGPMTSVNLSVSTGDVHVASSESACGVAAIEYGVTNNVDVTFRNQGVSNRVQVQIFLTRPEAEEEPIFNEEWILPPFDVRTASLTIETPARGPYRVRAVWAPLDLPESDASDNEVIAIYTNHAPRVFPNRVSVLADALPLTVPLAAQDPNGDAVTFAVLSPETASLAESGTAFVFDNGGTAGSFAVRVTASDGELVSEPATIMVDVYSNTTDGVHPPVITSATSLCATVGVSVCFAVIADYGPCQYHSDDLPYGLTLNETTGEITGILHTASSYTFAVTATNLRGSDTADFTLNVAALLADNDAFADATTLTGSAVSFLGSTFTATTEAGEPAHAGVAADYSVWWRWTAPSTGVVGIGWENDASTTAVAVYTGTAVSDLTEQGSFFGSNAATYFEATSGQEYVIALSAFTEDVFALTLAYHLEPQLRSPSWVDAVQGSPIDLTFQTWNTATSFTATSLPEGLALDPETGRLSGTPSVSGFYNVTLTLSNAVGASTATVSLQIASANPPRIVGPLYATATQGEPFACTVLVQNASSFWANPLPDGLLSDSATGIISGIPTTNGAFSVFLSASDGASGFDWQELVLWIRPPYTTWLTDSGFTPEEQNNAAIGGEDADPDGDGMVNRNEFIAGTDPLDPDDVLRLSLSFQNGALSLAWPGRENRRYAIQQSDTLTSGFTVMTNDIHAVFPSTEISMPASRPTAFFRIHVQE